jgi:endoribonuclease Dicer
MRQFCEALPADRLLQGDNCSMETALGNELHMRKYIDPETGATLTYGSSLVVLAHFLGCLVRSLSMLAVIY